MIKRVMGMHMYMAGARMRPRKARQPEKAGTLVNLRNLQGCRPAARESKRELKCLNNAPCGDVRVDVGYRYDVRDAVRIPGNTYPHGRKTGGKLAESWRKAGGNLAAMQGKPGGNLAETWRKPGGNLAHIMPYE
jgi:hypothetical protein